VRLSTAIDIHAGGPGSGCHGENCGRPIKDVVKSLKLPKGAKHRMNDDSYRWSKRGGYANKIMEQVHQAAEDGGFKRVASDSPHSADGNYMGRGSHFSNGEWHLSTSSMFGPTKDYNDHVIELHREKK